MTRRPTVSRTQGLVVGFFLAAWVTLAVILAVSPNVRDTTLERLPSTSTSAVIWFLVALLGFLSLLTIGVLRRWRWLFWLVLLAFAAGCLRVPVALLQLAGRTTAEGPDWYVVLQGVIGVVQAVIAAAMFAGYRRSGPWGDFKGPSRWGHSVRTRGS